jgi:predicted Zn-dependent peptidase
VWSLLLLQGGSGLALRALAFAFSGEEDTKRLGKQVSGGVQGGMRDTREMKQIRETLRFVLAGSIPADHKRILIEALTQSLQAAEEAERTAELQKKTPQHWRPEETAIMESLLRGKLVNSWQQADETLMRLSSELQRLPEEIRKKAIELDLGAAVDYAMAKIQRAAIVAQQGIDDRSSSR